MKVSKAQLFVILLAVEQGFKACEEGKNLEQALQAVHDIYKVEENDT